MNSLIVSSLFRYIINTSEANTENVVQFRLPSKTYSIEVVVELLKNVESYCGSHNSCKCEIKIAKQAIEYWKSNASINENALLNNALNTYPSWEDTKGNLTAYRNEANSNSDDKKILLLLVGYDLIDDKASLAHFLDCGEDVLWSLILRKEFKSWINYICDHFSLIKANEEVDKCNKLLLIAYRYSDLQRIDGFLWEVGGSNNRLSKSIGDSLYKLGLPVLDSTQSKNINNCNLILTRTKNYYDGNFVLDSSTKQAEKKIEELIELVEEDENLVDPRLKLLRDEEHYKEFDSLKDYLETCINIVKGIASEEEKEKFIKSDSATFVYGVLGYKTKARTKETVKVVSGMPFNAVLHALWMTLGNYIGNEDRSDIDKIRIVPIEFNHNYVVSNDEDSADNEAIIKELLIPYLGGIDKLICETIEGAKDINNILGNAEVESLLCPTTPGEKFIGNTPYKATKTPALTFDIIITGIDGDSVKNTFKIVFKKNCAINYTRKLVVNVFERLKDNFDSFYVPVFTLGKYGEFFDKTDSESDEFFVDLIDDPDDGVDEVNLVAFNTNTRIKGDIKNLYFSYKKYVQAIIEDGFYYAMMSKEAEDFSIKYQQILSSLTTKDSVSNDETLRVRMLKAFWIIDKDYSSQEELSNKKFKSGCLSVLHPAMVEMMNAQINYIKNYVCESIKEVLSEFSNEKITENKWQRIEDFATVQSPIPCVLDDSIIRTQTKGSDLLFKVGITGSDFSDNLPLSVTFDSDSELDLDEISDSELTRTTDESNLIRNLISDYIDSYGFSSDGMKIAIFMPVNIQAIMSAVIALVKNKIYPSQKNGEKIYPIYPFKLEIEFYSDPEDEGRIGLWIAKLNDYFAQKTLTEPDFAHVDLTVGYRMIRTGSDDIKITESIEKDFQADVSILYESHDAAIWKINEGLQAELRKIPVVDNNIIVRKFPMIEKLFPKRPISEDTSTSAFRAKLISNRQFITYEKYLGLMHSVMTSTEVVNNTAVVIEQFNFRKWLSLLDWCLDRSERVIAIGGEIDKELILNSNIKNGTKKSSDLVDIVGFGSGVGANANLNYIVASRLFSQKVSEEKLCNVFKRKFPAIELDSCKRIVHNLYEESTKMADLSLIRTLSCYTYYANNYLGYAMIRHILRPEEKSFCDVVLSLDSYKHWFNHSQMNRADLLWVVANRVQVNGNNIFKLKLTVIESKVANNVEDRHIDKAFLQINATISQLERLFSPSTNSNLHDARYWWMQLHRIVSSNAHIQSDNEIDAVLEALEYLAEGIFEIEWDSCIIAFEEGIEFAMNPTVLKNTKDNVGKDIPSIIMYSNGIESVMSKNSDISFDAFKKSLQTGSDYFVSMSKKELDNMIKEENEEKEKELFLISSNEDDGESVDSEIEEIIDLEGENFGSTGLFRYVDDDEKKEEVTNEAPLVKEQETVQDEIKVETPESGNSDTEQIIKPIIIEKQEPQVDPNLILIGKTKRKGESVYWNIAEGSSLTNRHMLILGKSGSGKSYAIKAILGELARKMQSSLIVDYTDGFVDGGLSGIENFIANEYFVKKGNKLPIDPFKVNENAYETSYDAATRVASVFDRIYTDIGNNQISLLADVIEEGIMNNPGKYTMDMLRMDLENKVDTVSGSKKNSFVTLETKIKPFCKTAPFKMPDKDYSAWDDIFFKNKDEKQITIFQLKSISLEIKKAIADFVLWDLWYYVNALNTGESKLYTVVLDEIQSLKINDANAPVYKYLSEGRKFGFGIIAASQGITGLGGAKGIGVDSLMNAGTILIFNPKPTEVDDLAKLIYKNDFSQSKEEWARTLNSLEKGECIYITNEKTSSKGKVARIVKISTFEERGLVK